MLLATVVGSSIVVLDGSIVNLALPEIAEDLQVDFVTLQWIADAYLLSLAALILLGGSLGDILGRKKVYLIGLLGFGVSSVLCAASMNGEMLIASRVLQGVFGALLVPGALAIIDTCFSPARHGKAIGRWAAWSSIAVVAAPFLGGWILSVASWRWVFLINVPLVAICYLLAYSSIIETKVVKRRKIDITGALLISAGLSGITYGLIEGPVLHWTLLPVAALISGLALCAAFLLYERRAKDPMVKLSLFKSRNFAGSNIMTFLMYGALSGFTFAFVIYLQTTMHYTVFEAGMSLLPVSVMVLLFAGAVGDLSVKYGPRFFMTAGPLFVAAGIAWLAFLHPGDSYMIGVLPGILLFAVGLTLHMSPLTTTVMASVSGVNAGIVSGINNAIARVAGLVVVAVLGLFGAGQAYPFASVLCAVLAALGGIVSFFVIEKIPAKKQAAVLERLPLPVLLE